MPAKKKQTAAPPVDADEVQPDAQTTETAPEATAQPDSDTPEPIAVKRRSRRERIEIGAAAPDETTIPESIPILPLRNAVLFPMSGLPLEASQARSLRLIDAVVNGDRRVVFVAQKDKEVEGAG